MQSQIITIPNPILKQTSQSISKIDDRVLRLIDQLISSLQGTKPEGVGIAAPQIGQNLRIFIIRFGKYYVPFLNPHIIFFSPETTVHLEGCLSIPEFYGEVRRPAEITIEAQNKHGKLIKKSYKRLAARVFQHELDHLNGILFIDRCLEQKGRIFKNVGQTKKGKTRIAEVKK